MRFHVAAPGIESFSKAKLAKQDFGEDEIVEKHYVSMRSRSQAGILAFLAADPEERSFCYSNADIRKGEEADEIRRFIAFWKSLKDKLPKHLVFDSKLTTQANLAMIDEMGIPFITLRRRSAMLLRKVDSLPASAWRKVELDMPNRKFNTPKYVEQKIKILGRTCRQIF